MTPHLSSQSQGEFQGPDSQPAAKGPEQCPAGPSRKAGTGSLRAVPGSEQSPGVGAYEQKLALPDSSSQDTTPPRRSTQLFRGPTGSQGNDGRWIGPYGSSHKGQGVLDTGRVRLPHDLSAQPPT